MTQPSIARACALALLLSGCTAFFEEPIDGPVPSGNVPSNSVPSNSIPAAPRTPAPATDASSDTASTVTNTVSADETNSQPGYFTIATFDELDGAYARLAFVHFTNLGPNRDTNRELALCQAVRSQYTPTPVAQVPDGVRLLVWPVREANVDDICLEMLTKYEPVDIRQSTAQRVGELAAGPFLLARSSADEKRMIYDMSNLRRNALPQALRAWGQLFRGSSQQWPEYRYAR